jgi:hypothetical protein
VTGAVSTPDQSPDDAPLFERSGSTTRTVLRRVVAVLLSLFIIGFLFVSATFHAAVTLVGTPANTANTFLAVVDSSSVPKAIAAQAVAAIANNAPANDQQKIMKDELSLETVFTQTLVSAKVTKVVRNDIDMIWGAYQSGSPLTLPLTNLVEDFLLPLHASLSSVPANWHDYANTSPGSFTITMERHTPVGSEHSYALFAWILSIAGVLGAVLVARFMVRHRPLQLIYIGLVVGIPGVLLFGLGRSNGDVQNYFKNLSPVTKAVLTPVLGRVGTDVMDQGAILMVVAAGIILIWGGIRLIRTGRTAPISAT